mmetsp:Transcript_54510/g.151977  ORF Transcript_54510/g.151977 Transcript_54510/m.151977 type:complete len:208 (+) Transcript_54510:59-682(+)
MAEVIVVLGQALNPCGGVPGTLHARVQKTVALHRDRSNVPVIVTGGDPAKRGVSEAEVMAQLLRDAGVEDVVLEPRALNTCQNALEVLRLLPEDCKQISLVTSDFHMPRAAYIFEAVFSLHCANLALEQHSACGGQGSASDSGINAMSLSDRLHDEINNLENRLIQEFLPSHIPGQPVPPLPPERLERALVEVRSMLESCNQPSQCQ